MSDISRRMETQRRLARLSGQAAETIRKAGELAGALREAAQGEAGTGPGNADRNEKRHAGKLKTEPSNAGRPETGLPHAGQLKAGQDLAESADYYILRTEYYLQVLEKLREELEEALEEALEDVRKKEPEITLKDVRKKEPEGALMDGLPEAPGKKPEGAIPAEQMCLLIRQEIANLSICRDSLRTLRAARAQKEEVEAVTALQRLRAALHKAGEAADAAEEHAQRM